MCIGVGLGWWSVHTGLDAEATEGATADTYNGAGVISLDLIDEAKI